MRADTPGIPKSHRELVLVAPYNDVANLTSIVEIHHGELAGIFFEPASHAR